MGANEKISDGGRDPLNFFNAINGKLFNNEIKLIYSNLFLSDPRRAKASGLNKVFYILPDVIRETNCTEHGKMSPAER